ncbi:MAG TPA: hypothetical protein VGB46_09285 [Flavisolibacter sp.]|jgi:hypothetical protein
MKLNNPFIPTRLIALLAILFLVSCKEADGPPAEGSGRSAIYFDYQVTGEEGRDDVTCLMRFQEGDAEGDAVLLPPGAVEMDGQPVSPDSARITGVYYEVRRPLAEFAGVHRISFTDSKKNRIEQEFTFSPFTLKTDLPARISRRNFVLDLDGVEKGTTIRLVLTDTSFESQDINKAAQFSGPIRLDPFILNKLVNGPIILIINSEEERRVMNKARGRISISYGLQREFELVD